MNNSKNMAKYLRTSLASKTIRIEITTKKNSEVVTLWFVCL